MEKVRFQRSWFGLVAAIAIVPAAVALVAIPLLTGRNVIFGALVAAAALAGAVALVVSWKGDADVVTAGGVFCPTLSDGRGITQAFFVKKADIISVCLIQEDGACGVGVRTTDRLVRLNRSARPDTAKNLLRAEETAARAAELLNVPVNLAPTDDEPATDD